jgi:hypothetical protein
MNLKKSTLGATLRSTALVVIASVIPLHLTAGETRGATGTLTDLHGKFARHISGVFLGVTSGEGENTLTVGAEYEFLITSKLGVGAVWESSPDRHHGDGTAVGLATLGFHPANGRKIVGGVGRERVFDKKSHRYELFRAGVSYDFHVGKFGIAPAFNVDFVNHSRNYVYGLSIVRAF